MHSSICLLFSICLAFIRALPEKRFEAPSIPADNVGAKEQVNAPVDISEHWESFKNKFGKKYESESEEAKRKEHFRAAHELIEEHNKLHDLGLKSFRTGHSHLSDLSLEEFKKMNGYKPSPEQVRIANYEQLMSAENSECDQIPTKPSASDISWDWRDYGYVTPVLYQGDCGDCYTFGSTGALEGQHKKKTGKLVALSQQNILDCASGNAKYNIYGCNGGAPQSVYAYIKDNGGIDTLASYPYTAIPGECRFNKSNVGATDTGTAFVIPTEEALKTAIREIGPIDVLIFASLPSFKQYQSGVYNDPECTNDNLDHSVLVVGYGTDPVQGDYWIIKNSWGWGWGIEGYMWLARNNNNECGVTSLPLYPTV